MLVLKINGTDRSSWINWESLTKTEGLTKEVDTLAFRIVKTPSKTIPILGEDITLFEDSIKIFGGVIIQRQDYIVGGVLMGFDIKCKDYTQLLDNKLVVKSYIGQTARAIILDILATFTSGFTSSNVAVTTPTIASIKFNYEQVSKALQKLADLCGFDWYPDYNKDIHFFDESTMSAPFEITDIGGKFEWPTLNFDRNLMELKNSAIIRGGEYLSSISSGNSVDKYSADGTQRVFNCIYRYTNVVVTVAGSSKTVGIDNIDNPASFDCLYNFQEKAVKFRDDNKPSSSQEVKIYGDAHIPLIAKVRDQVSISTYGEIEHIQVDKSITSVSEAQTKAKAILDKWSEGSSAGSFKTTQTGLQTGQQIKINSTAFGVNQYFKINRIIGKARGSDHMEYQVFFIASGEYTFTDIMMGLLSKDLQNIDISNDEVLQRLEIFPESVSVADVLLAVKKIAPYKWGPGSSNDLVFDFGTWA